MIATFDFVDIADGTGVVKFNGYTTKDSTGVSYALDRTAFFSAQIETSQQTSFTSDTFVKTMDIDIDLGQFNISKIVDGRATIQTSFAMERTGGTGDFQMFIKYIIKKVSGGETIIGTVQTETVTRIPNGTTKRFVVVDISLTRTSFKKGDILRLTVEGWGRDSTGADNVAGKITIVHDPQDRDGTVITPSSDDMTTKLDVYIPFKLDI